MLRQATIRGLSNPNGASGQMRSLFVALVFVVLSAAATPAKECTVGQYEADKEDMIAATKAGTLKADLCVRERRNNT